jgi:hypothetical protein
MWICERCGEPHEDRFKVCWKCAGDEHQHHVTAEPIPFAPHVVGEGPERKLRSLGSILVRALIAFVVATIGGAAFFHRTGATLEDAITAGAIAGAAVGAFVGVFIWVVFPYEPIGDIKPRPAPDELHRDPPD